MVKHPKILGVSIVSSVDVEKYSLFIKGFLATTATGLAYFGIVLPLGDISPLIDQLGTLVLQISAAVGTAITIYGGIRRLINTLRK